MVDWRLKDEKMKEIDGKGLEFRRLGFWRNFGTVLLLLEVNGMESV